MITMTTIWLQWKQHDYNDNNMITMKTTWLQWQHHDHNDNTCWGCTDTCPCIWIGESWKGTDKPARPVLLWSWRFAWRWSCWLQCVYYERVDCLTCVMLLSKRPAKWGGLLWLPHLRIYKSGVCVTRKKFYWDLYKKTYLWFCWAMTIMTFNTIIY